ncbi:MAG: amino acid permease C-terminal domain-containing protein, partial [Gemella morbillorum]
GIMMLTGSFDMLTDLLVFVMWFFYTATFFAVIILRKKDPDLERPYKVPLYPIIPMIAILGGLYTLISTLTSQITLALGGIGLTLIGLLFYTELHKKFKK